MVERRRLLTSLDRQRRLLDASIVLTPVDSVPFALDERAKTGFLHGLYLTDKVRDLDQQQAAVVQFAGRHHAAQDLDSIHSELANRLGAAAGSMRLLSGLHAHTAVFMSIASSGQRVLLLPERGGGHFSTPAILQRLGLDVVEMRLDEDRMCVDRGSTLALAAEVAPDFVFIDRSEGLRFEDFSFLNAIDAVRIFDASQYLPQILAGRYPNPLRWGFDLMLFSLHKSFPGPQKAGIVAAETGTLWDQLIHGLSTFVSSSHAENTYLAGFALLEREALAAFADDMLALADALRHALNDAGVVDVVAADEQGSSNWATTQHLWVRCQSLERAFELYLWLGRIRIQTNYRLLPYGLGYGLRLGTTHATAAGIRADEAEQLAELISNVVLSGPSPALRHDVRLLAERARDRV